MTIGARRWAGPAVALLVATAALTGCAESGAQTAGPSPSATRWQEPARYTFVLLSTCGERALIGRFRITVEQGKVVRAEGLDESARRAVEIGTDIVPTLGQLVDELDSARRAGAHLAQIATDPTDGHPTKITIDPAANAIDDEACYAITEFAA